MADTTGDTTDRLDPPEPDSGRRKPGWRSVGPGIVVAATGVGAGDLVATLIAGGGFGYTLLWAAVLGCLVKISLAEAVGRWHLATGRTLFEGWATLGAWTGWFFGIYVVIWGFVYGAAAMSATALPLHALFPGVMGLEWWGVCTGLVGLIFVWFNRYAVFEKVMTVLVGVMFVVTVSLALRVTPNVGAAVAGLLPVVPDEEGAVFNTLGLIGGVGGTITLAAYGYWINAKGWSGPRWMAVMRWDNRIAYLTTGVFVVSMLVVGAELLRSARIALSGGGQGLLQLGSLLEERYGSVTATLFLVGFLAATFTSLIGVWHGVSLLFADFVERGWPRSRGGSRGRGEGPAAPRARERSRPFRVYLLWLTFPPMLLLFRGEPFRLVVLYGVLGAAFMPFLALTLVRLLNSSRTPREWRSGVVSNAMLGLAGVLFLALGAREVLDQPWSDFF
ncbi:Nramp family divalent metal transporter [Streptomyces sp. HSG2]|uniref:Nramp family divalent metal transporter n=1 Tax=Streptomyces sp. HSG2 TaxID=2797167 RepID=UPI0019042FAD|nr:Nramp family divalent metal transporter [Streptomyces sp. HSG2]